MPSLPELSSGVHELKPKGTWLSISQKLWLTNSKIYHIWRLPLKAKKRPRYSRDLSNPGGLRVLAYRINGTATGCSGCWSWRSTEPGCRAAAEPAERTDVPIP